MVHTYSLNGYNIALDVASGAVHVLDDLSFALLPFVSEKMEETLPGRAAAAFPERGRNELEEAWAELRELRREGQLFSKDDLERYQSAVSAGPIKSMCLNVAHDCNLRCSYCFASTGDFGGGRKLMPLEVGCRAIDFLMENSGTRKHLEVDFFGGEPLMNFEVVKQIVSYARKAEKQCGKVIRFTITTNGVLLDDDKIDFINREMGNVVLSLDGRREVNDRMRKRVDGTGSYDTILPKIKRFREKRGDREYYVRGTYTAENLDFLQDVLHLYGEGFDQVSVEPVIASSDKPYAIAEKDLPRIFAEYEALAKKYIQMKKVGEKINFFHFMIDLENAPCAIKLLRGCGCGNEYVAVTPEGDIYPCHQFVGRPQWKMGNVLEEKGLFTSPIKDRFSRVHIYSKPSCRDCWAKFYCGGGCAANNEEFSGDIKTPPELTCALEKKRVECAIMIKAALADAD